MTKLHVLEFSPRNVQFVMYDIKAVLDDPEDELPLWTDPSEIDQPISVRWFQVSVGLIEDSKLRLELNWSSSKPKPIKGDWEVQAETSLEVPSGRFGVADVRAKRAKLTLKVPADRQYLRIYGRMDQYGQVFAVQIWPAKP